MKRSLLAVAMLGLAACASGPETTHPSSPAFTEEMVSANRYRITYAAPESASRQEVTDRLLRRAAQLTLDKDNEWFEVASRVDSDGRSTLVIVMGEGETLAGGPNRIYDAKETLSQSGGRVG